MGLHFASNQNLGLSVKAKGLVSQALKEASGRFIKHGLYGPALFPLYKYTLPDGCVFYENVRIEFGSPDSPGRLFFLALQKKRGKFYIWVPESLWPEEEMTKIVQTNTA